MKKEIYFLFATPPLAMYMQKYCIDYFENNDWIVHIIDLSPLVHPEAYRVVTTGLVPEEKREIFFSKKEYRAYMKKTAEGAVFVLGFDFYYDTYFVNMNVKKKQYYGYIGVRETSVELTSQTVQRRTNDFLKQLSFHRIAMAIFNRIPRKLLPMRAADFIILGGYENREFYIKRCHYDNHTIVQHFHTWDYEKYLEAKKYKERIIKEPYCVFLDQFLPFHPDNVDIGITLDAQMYYNQLEAFFRKLEETFSIKVVIATHPRGDYSKHPGVLDHFMKFRFKTAELVKDAEFVLAHFSTSINFAVTFKKPLILLTSDELNSNTFIYSFIQKYAQLLGSRLINLSDKYDITRNDFFTVDVKKYEQYVKSYLKADYSSDENNDVSYAKPIFDFIEGIADK